MASVLRRSDPNRFPYPSSDTPNDGQNLSVWPATAFNISYYDTGDWLSVDPDPFDDADSKLNNTFALVLRNGTTIRELPEEQLSRRLWFWITPLLLIVGTFGNLLSFFTLRSCTFRKCSIAFTLSALAVVDTSVLYTVLLRQWIMSLTGYDVRVLLWSFGCKLHLFLTYYLCQLSSWTLVVVTAERAICVSMPFMAKTACTKSRIVGSWFLVATILAIINSHLLWTAEYVQMEVAKPGNRTVVESMCFTGARYRLFLYDFWYWMDFALLSIIPFIFIIVGNVVITVCVCRAMEFRRQQAIPITPYSAQPLSQTSTVSSPSSQTKTFKPLTSSTTMLIGISVLFLLTTTPSAIYFIVSNDWIGSSPDQKTVARIRLVYTITNLVYYANNSLNFLLYCLTGSRFRRALVEHFRRGDGVVSRARRLSRGIITIGTRSSNCNLVNGNVGLQLQRTTDY